MKPADLVAHAERLEAAAKRKPHQADLRRAVSAAYYALFHAVAAAAADTLIGTTVSHRASPIWSRVYRSLEHGFAKDYDPKASFLRSDVVAHIRLARTAVAQLEGASTADRRTFASWLIFKSKA